MYSSCDVLLDCHNLWQPWPKTVLDLEVEVELVCQRISSIAVPLLGRTAEARVRFYDGWRDIAGNPTGRARLLLALLPQIRGLRHDLRLLPSIAEGVFDTAWSPLRGTFRTVPSPPHQKMVDVLLANDLVRISGRSRAPLLLFSDDDDYVPALLAASTVTAAGVTAVRRRPLGRSVNDSWLSAAGVTVIAF